MLLYLSLIIGGLISAILVIVSNNPIHGVLALILLFLNSSILLLTYEINFLALIIIIIYLGAVTIYIFIYFNDVKFTNISIMGHDSVQELRLAYDEMRKWYVCIYVCIKKYLSKKIFFR